MFSSTVAKRGSDHQQFDVKEHLLVDRIPAKYTATRYLQPVYGCPCCKDHVTTREMPLVTPIAKGLAGISLLTFVLVSKYQYHLTLYRVQRQIYHESRIWFTRSTLCTWVGQCCGLLERIYKGLLHLYRKSIIKHAVSAQPTGMADFACRLCGGFYRSQFFEG